MQRIVSGAIAALAVAWTIGQAAPVAAQEAKTSNVKIAYDEPQSAALRPVYDRLKQREVLERLQKFLSPLKLPRELNVRTAECGTQVRPYRTGEPVTLCYEFVLQVEKQAPPADRVGAIGQALITRNMAIVGPIVHALLHDSARAIFDMLEIPVWGNAVDAADHAAAFLMLQFGADVAQKTLFGTAYFLAVTSEQPFDPLSVAPHLIQRYYNMLCMAIGYDFVRYAVFIPVNRQQGPGDLPLFRVGNCITLDPAYGISPSTER